ncbi:MAG: spermidine/putrescine ABC transporter substrate-binding protein [Oculatellaceae cyanobacterium bins.114]|nr:spermidine/putrescine ABC transporter substrate-binding protein [Oculatellaceae cyanobacterium bins.114]
MNQRRTKFISSLSRRKFIQFASTASLAAATTRLIGCTSQPTPAESSPAAEAPASPTASGGTLRILSWSGYDEPEVIGKFQEQTGAKVEFKTYVGGEQMLQFFNQSPPGTFDGIISDGEYVKKLVELGAVEALNADDFPEIKNFIPAYQDFPGFIQDGNVMAVGTRYGNYGIAFNTKYIKPEEVTSWEFLTREDLKGKVAFFDWYLPNMGNASLALFPDNPNPYELTDDQLQQVKDWLIKVKPNVALITPNIQDITNAFINESIIAGPVGDWLIQNAIADGHDNFAAVVPKEGSIRWSEGATVCSASQNKALALEWVKYMSLPETQARLANAKAYKGIAPNLKAVDFMSDAEKQLLGYVPDPDTPDKLVVEVQIERSRARQLPVNQPEKVWQDLYNEFKTS